MKYRVKVGNIIDRMAPALRDSIHKAAQDGGHTTDDLEVKRATSAEIPANAFLEGQDAIVQIVSTRGIDRDGEIIIPKGIDLAQFRAAGAPVLWGHDYSRPPIGSDEWIKVADGGRSLMAKSVYSKTAFAQEVFQLRKEGHLATSSIGFIATEWIGKGEGAWDKTLREVSKWAEMAGKTLDSLNRVITKGILLEHSDVSVPANPEALQLAISKGFNLSDDMFSSLKIQRIEAEPEQKQNERIEITSVHVEAVEPPPVVVERIKAAMKPVAEPIAVVKRIEKVTIKRLNTEERLVKRVADATQEQIDRMYGRV